MMKQSPESSTSDDSVIIDTGSLDAKRESLVRERTSC